MTHPILEQAAKLADSTADNEDYDAFTALRIAEKILDIDPEQSDGEYEAFMAGWNCCSAAADDNDPKLPDEYWAELEFDGGAKKGHPITDGEIEAVDAKNDRAIIMEKIT